MLATMVEWYTDLEFAVVVDVGSYTSGVKTQRD